MAPGLDRKEGLEYAFGDFVLIPAPMKFERDGQPVPLTMNAFRTLLFLVEHPNRVVTKRELLDYVWADAVVEENSLNQCITALRRAFGDTRKEARYIATVSGAGYRFAMEVTVRERTPVSSPVPEPTSTLSAEPTNPHRNAGFLERHKSAVRAAGVAGAILAIVAVAAARWYSTARSATTVLVLPLASYGPPAPDLEYIRKGFSTEIEAALARTPGLHVAGGVPDFVLNERNVAEVAHKVNARVALRGQIRENADQLNFTFELVNLESSRILWSDQFGMKADELTAAESRVVSGVVNAVAPWGSTPERRPVNAAAHELYLRGRLLGSTRRQEDLQKAIELFEQAVAVDSTYADAYTGIADAASMWAVNGVAPPGTLQKARAAALRAIDLDRNSAPAHAALGLTYYGEWQWADARRELQEAVRLNPSYSTTHHRLAMLHYVFNNYAASESELKLAQELNPYLLAHATTLCEVYIYARRYDDVLRIFASVLSGPENSYGHYLAAEACHFKRDYAAELRELRLAVQAQHTPDASALLAIAEGRPSDARRIAAEQGIDDGVWATVYARLGDRERVLAILRKLIDNRNVTVVSMKDDPAFDAYRSGPAFRELIQRLHLPASESQ
jgi:DNA-binding winged helix-turn-helix (wHTH) protein/TolB-like protein